MLYALRMKRVFPLAALAAVVVAAPAAAAVHQVARGESLSSIAAADGLSVAQLAAANGLSPTAGLRLGQLLTIPPQGGGDELSASASTAAVQQPATSNEGRYVVQPGDTLTAIAERAGTTVASIAAANHLNPNGIIVIGTVLSLNGVSATGAAASTSEASAGAEAPPSTVSTGGPPYPTHEYVSSGEVGSIAAANGVPASLADAIGWQESGFNNDLVSRTGAAGVMQIEPSTWSWIQTHLSGGQLAPASAHDNVVGGVLLLRQLLADTGGDPAMAAAAYYQGLASVQRSGMYPSTRGYVNDVLALRSKFGG
jgi:LysM repeat protein